MFIVPRSPKININSGNYQRTNWSMEMFVWSGNKVLSVEFLMLLILLLVIKTINASTVPSLNDLSHVKSNKCEEISLTQHCPELKYNQTTVSNIANGHHLDINDANEMVRRIFCHSVDLIHEAIDLMGTAYTTSCGIIGVSFAIAGLTSSTAATINRNSEQTKNTFVNDSAWRRRRRM